MSGRHLRREWAVEWEDERAECEDCQRSRSGTCVRHTWGYEEPSLGITMPPGDNYQIVAAGEILWQGHAQDFAALIGGMQWEEICINSDQPTHRRLVSKVYPIDRPTTGEETT